MPRRGLQTVYRGHALPLFKTNFVKRDGRFFKARRAAFWRKGKSKGKGLKKRKGKGKGKAKGKGKRKGEGEGKGRPAPAPPSPAIPARLAYIESGLILRFTWAARFQGPHHLLQVLSEAKRDLLKLFKAHFDVIRLVVEAQLEKLLGGYWWQLLLP